MRDSRRWFLTAAAAFAVTGVAPCRAAAARPIITVYKEPT